MASVTNTDLADWRDFLQTKQVNKKDLWMHWRCLDVVEKYWSLDADADTLQSCLDKVASNRGWSGFKIPLSAGDKSPSSVTY